MSRKLLAWLTAMAVLFTFTFGSLAYAGKNVPNTVPAKKSTLDYLKNAMDKYHKVFYVYEDSDSAGNHFSARARMSSWGDGELLPSMQENFITSSHSGKSCIKCDFKASGLNWGGWYFMNGVMKKGDAGPRENWGDTPQAGINLQGVTKLSFWARGEKGGERVEFFCGGVGRDAGSGLPTKLYPDSSTKASTGFLTLTKEWKQYTINLKGRDMSYVLGGFGWVTSASDNGGSSISFYIDDISYDKQRLNEPRFITSYETLGGGMADTILSNTAFSYDNAAALMAFLAAGEKDRARLIAEALVYAQQNDRYYSDGRIRNAYKGGDLKLPPGWEVDGRKYCVSMPGWYDNENAKWLEDEFQISTHTGNVAWTMLALTSYYRAAGGDKYLASAVKMGDWVEKYCRDTRGAGGYTGGFSGFESNETKLSYKSTEHNLDLYAAFMQLYDITKNKIWLERASNAKRFVEAMWDKNESKFWTGTTNDGVTINKGNIPLDIQPWVLLSLKDDRAKYVKALGYAEKNQKVGGGFDFNNDKDGIWYEGTAQMAAAYNCLGLSAKYQEVLKVLGAARDYSGGMYAAGSAKLTTGFYLNDGSPWLYYRRIHVGATAWTLLAEKGANPFWLGYGKVK